MQGARAAARSGAERVEHKHGDVHIKFFTVFGDTKIAAMHGACGRAQARTAGVFEGLPWLQQGLLADDAQSLDLFRVPIGIVDIPGSRDQLRRDATGVGDRDGVRKHVQTVLRRGLLRQILREYLDAESVGGTRFGHSRMLPRKIGYVLARAANDPQNFRKPL